MNADPLSEVLELAGARSLSLTRLEAAGDWALAFRAKTRLKFVALLRGNCWICIPGRAALLLKPGDTFLLGNTSYVVASDPGRTPTDGEALYRAAEDGSVRLGGEDTLMLGGTAEFAVDVLALLESSLPDFMLVTAQAPMAAILRDTLALLDLEMSQAQAGRSLVCGRLADVLLVQVLRACLSDRDGEAAGWIGALADPQIGRALQAMHADVGRDWTVADLASHAGMSRSAFARDFRKRAGQAPLTYLRRWRMTLARRALRSGHSPVGPLAARLGYASESAFGHAYKKTFGYAPTHDRLSKQDDPD